MVHNLKVLDESTDIGAVIKKIRKERRITQTQLADYAGLSRAGIAKIEAGSSDIKLSTLMSVMNLLGLDIQLCDRGNGDS